MEEAFSKYRTALQLVIATREKENVLALQKSLYTKVRQLGVPSMMACYLFRDAKSILSNGALFSCPTCGYLGNADRNASVNIARRAAFRGPSSDQISARNLSVMAGVLVHEGAE